MSQNYQSKTHVFYSPTKIIVGQDTASQAATESKQFGGGKVLIVTDPGVVKAGLLEPIESSLKNDGVDYFVYDGVEPEPPSRVIDKGAEIFKSESCQLVMGVGGGSSLDVAKGISIMGINEGNILDYCGFDMVPKKGAPIILVPTTSGTGSEVTRVLVLTDEAQNTKNAVFTPYAIADVALVDPLLTTSMPPTVTADTGIDALVHAIETYVSMNATVFSDTLAEKAIELIAENLPTAFSKGSNIEARYNMSLAATLAGMAFGSGGLGAVHGLAYPLGTEYHMTHGRTNAIMLSHIMRFNLPGSPKKYARIAELMGQDIEAFSIFEAAELAVEAVQDLLTTINISYRIRDYGIPEEDIPKLVSGGMEQARLFVPNPRDLDEEDVDYIYREAY